MLTGLLPTRLPFASMAAVTAAMVMSFSGGAVRGDAQRGAGSGTVTIRAARVLDGRGGLVERGVVEVSGSTIRAVDQRAGPVTSDLGDLTVLPGMIDVHVHLNWFFGPNGKYGEPDVPAGYQMDAVLDNARETLMAGFTTVQSLGAPQDKPLREAIAAGVVPGPRLLSSLGQLQGGTQTPDQLRERVRALKQAPRREVRHESRTDFQVEVVSVEAGSDGFAAGW